MNPSDLNTLKAFLAALPQMEQSLPTDIQSQLHEIARTLTDNPPSIGNLDALAKSYEPLKPVYKKEFEALLEAARERNKGLKPLPLSNLPTPELTNIAIDTFSANDSVAAAKNITKPNILKRIWQSIRGSH